VNWRDLIGGIELGILLSMGLAMLFDRQGRSSATPFRYIVNRDRPLEEGEKVAFVTPDVERKMNAAGFWIGPPPPNPTEEPKA
jgi:hypothetical protein